MYPTHSSGAAEAEDCADCWQGAISLAAYLAHQLQSSLIRLSETAAAAAPSIAFLNNVKKANQKLTCCKCDGVLQQPITLHCGHSMCRSCCCWRRRRGGGDSEDTEGPETAPDDDVVVFECAKCAHRQDEEPKTNVTVMAIVDCWWKDQLEATGWRQKGDAQQQQQQLDTSIDCYDKALQLGNHCAFYHYAII